MKCIGEVEVELHAFLTSALGGPDRLAPRERAPGIYRTGRWVGNRAILDPVAKRKIPNPFRESNPAMKAYGKMVVQSPVFFTLVVYGGEWSAYAPVALPPVPLQRMLYGYQTWFGRGGIETYISMCVSRNHILNLMLCF
jgi:hypothetical protein